MQRIFCDLSGLAGVQMLNKAAKAQLLSVILRIVFPLICQLMLCL